MPSPVHAAIVRFFRTQPAQAGTTLVALSGGADSAALLFAMADLRDELGIRVHAAHLNHGMRAEADEQTFRLQELCADLDVPFTAGKIDVPALAASDKLSLEVAGRRARYAFLYETAAIVGADSVCTAHTRDDQVETVLLRVIAGTGLQGLSGIPAVRYVEPPESPRPLVLLRPILTAGRADTEGLCAERGWQPFQDSANQDRSYARNRVRHDLLPLLERDYNPGIRTALVKLADLARADDEALEALTEGGVSSTELSVDGFITFPIPELLGGPLAVQRRIVRRLVAAAGGIGRAVGYESVDRVLTLARDDGQPIELPGCIRVDCHRGILRLRPNESAE